MSIFFRFFLNFARGNKKKTKGTLTATTLLQHQDITENMLPETGYYFDASELVEGEATINDNINLTHSPMN